MLNGLLSSRLRHHVGELGQLNEDGEHKLLLSPNELPMLDGALPQLRSLSIAVEVQPFDSPLQFPTQLQSLSVLFSHSSADAPNTATALLLHIGRLQQLHTLHLHLESPSVSLQRLPLLCDLDLHVHVGHASASASRAELFAAELRALPWLRRLRIDTAGSSIFHRVALLRALLREGPEALQWRGFSIVGFDELTSLLLRLPLLGQWEAFLSSCHQLDFLAALPHLTHLDLRLWSMNNEEWKNLFGVFTSDGLVRLRTLALRGAPCNDANLILLLSHTPSLTNLVLDRLRAVESLSIFLELPKLAQTLTHLTVECRCAWRLTAADLPHFYVLQQLRVLRLLRWQAAEPVRLIASDLAPFQQRPCIVLPHLDVFEWTAAV
jgi:hypothetical protein